jgi:hypothetical protein
MPYAVNLHNEPFRLLHHLFRLQRIHAGNGCAAIMDTTRSTTELSGLAIAPSVATGRSLLRTNGKSAGYALLDARRL